MSQASTHSWVSARVTGFGSSNGKRPFPGKRLGNVSQDRSDDEADENTYEDDGDVENLDLFSNSDKYLASPNFQAQLYML